MKKADACCLSLKISIITKEKINHKFGEHPFSIIIYTRSPQETKDISIIIPLSEYLIDNYFIFKDYIYILFISPGKNMAFYT